MISRCLSTLGAWKRAPSSTSISNAADVDPEDPAHWVGLDYVHDRVVGQLSGQGELWEEADSRLSLSQKFGRLRLVPKSGLSAELLGVIGIVFAVTLGLLPRRTVAVSNSNGGTTSEPQYLPFVVGVPAIIGLVLFAVAGTIALIAYWPREFNLPPAPDSLRKYVTTNEEEVKAVGRPSDPLATRARGET